VRNPQQFRRLFGGQKIAILHFPFLPSITGGIRKALADRRKTGDSWPDLALHRASCVRLWIRGFDMRNHHALSKRKGMSKQKAALKTYTIPIVPRLNTWGPWEVQVNEDTDPEFSFKLPRPKLERTARRIHGKRERIDKNVLEVRERVFAIRKDRKYAVQDAMALFKKFGPWHVAALYDSQASNVRLSDVEKTREFYQEALVANSNHWTSENGKDLPAQIDDAFQSLPLPMEFLFVDPPLAVVRCKDIESSLHASVFLDKVNGFKSGFCKREDCGKWFQFTPYRTHYCSDACAHLQAVREYNKKHPNQSKTRKGKV
jgi:hypothetical protein